MDEKQYKYSLTGFEVLGVLALAKEGKHLILVDDNKFKVVDIE